jgi:hypothetical protein
VFPDYDAIAAAEPELAMGEDQPSSETVIEEPAAMPAPMPSATTDASARTGAGISIVLAGAGVITGWLVGGGWGAGAGLLLVGAARNGYKARSIWGSDRAEAAKRLTMAVAGGAGGGYMAYRAMKGRKDR